MKCWLNLRHAVPERARAFHTGLARLGYSIASGCTTNPGPKDIFVSWGRITHDAQRAAATFEDRGLPVIIAENAPWGNDFMGGHWYTLARGTHNLSGRFPLGGAERWAALGCELLHWRTEGETVILPQRGIGDPAIAMPRGWADTAFQRYGGRVRPHPGPNKSAKPLEADLAQAGRVITWGSGAAVRASIMGIRVTYELPGWIGAHDNTDTSRLAMFERMAWANWTLQEITTGEPFERLLA